MFASVKDNSVIQMFSCLFQADFTKRVLQSVAYMTSKQKSVKNRSLCYFSLPNPKSVSSCFLPFYRQYVYKYV